MKVAIFGDVHCEWGRLNRTIFKALNRHSDVTHLVQVGDLGYGWPRTNQFELDRRMADTMVESVPDQIFEKAQTLPFYWIDGNHENFDRLESDNGAFQPNMIYQSRGSVVEFPSEEGRALRAMFFGGASSIDKQYRIPGITWWGQESITQSEVITALSQKGPIDIVFSHEHPTSFRYRNYNDNCGTSDREGLEAIRKNFRPKNWVFGHHHDFKRGEFEGTEWMCAPIIDDLAYIIWDGHKLQFYGSRSGSLLDNPY